MSGDYMPNYSRVMEVRTMTDANAFLQLGWILIRVCGSESPTYVLGKTAKIGCDEEGKIITLPIPYPEMYNGRLHTEQPVPGTVSW